MDRQEFLKILELPIMAARLSGDETVKKAGFILSTLQGSILAGDDFVDPLFDAVMAINSNQMAILLDLQKKTGGSTAD